MEDIAFYFKLLSSIYLQNLLCRYLATIQLYCMCVTTQKYLGFLFN